MLRFLDHNKWSIYTLFASLFLLALANLIKLPILNSVNIPADTITVSTDATEREHLSAAASNLSDPAATHETTRPISATTTHLASANTGTNSGSSISNVNTSYANSISYSGLTIPIFYTNDYMIDSGNSVGFYGNYLLYGHNSANVFGGLSALAPGATITLTINGQSSTHQVLRTSLLTKEQTANYMRAVLNGRHIGGDYEHNYVLMTCAGTSYGNGDASHRYLVFIK